MAKQYPSIDSLPHRKLVARASIVISGILLILFGWSGLLESNLHVLLAAPLLRWALYAMTLSITFGYLSNDDCERYKLGSLTPVVASLGAGWWLGSQQTPLLGVPLLLLQIVLEAIWTAKRDAQDRFYENDCHSIRKYIYISKVTIFESIPSIAATAIAIAAQLTRQ